MLDLETLLRLPSADLRRASRIALAGFAAAIRESLVSSPETGPDRAHCEAFLAALDRALVGGEAGPDSPATTPNRAVETVAENPRPVTAPAPCDAFADLLRNLVADEGLRNELGSLKGITGTEAEQWRVAHMLLLRATPATAATWRERLRQVRDNRIQEDISLADCLPGDALEWLIPPLDGAAPVRGVCLHPEALLDKRLESTAEELPPLSAALARSLTVLLWYADHAPEPSHALESVNKFWPAALRETQKQRVLRELFNRFQRLREAETNRDLRELVQAWVAVDEAVHCITHNPIPPESSWLRRQQKKARDTLPLLRQQVQADGRSIHAFIPTGSYADLDPRYQNRDSDKAAKGLVPPGHVVLCLRVYAKMDDLECRGRVLYQGYS